MRSALVGLFSTNTCPAGGFMTRAKCRRAGASASEALMKQWAPLRLNASAVSVARLTAAQRSRGSYR